MGILLSIITIVASTMFVILIGMRLFRLGFIKHDDGSWTIYNTEIFDEAERALEELKKEIDILTEKVVLTEEKAGLLKKENVTLKELVDAREEQVGSLASAIKEYNTHSGSNDSPEEPDSSVYSHVVVREDGLKEESEEAIRKSAEMLNQILVKEEEESD